METKSDYKMIEKFQGKNLLGIVQVPSLTNQNIESKYLGGNKYNQNYHDT